MPTLAFLFGACIAVDGDVVHLSDLLPTMNSGASRLSLGFAPVPGARREFTAAAINRLLTKHGLPPYQGEDLCVERTGRRLEEKQIKDALFQTLAAQNATVEVVDMDKKLVPPGKLEFPMSGLIPPSPVRTNEPILWRGRVHAGPNYSVPVWVKVRLQVPVVRVVAVEDLPANAPVQESQVRSEAVMSDTPMQTAVTVESVKGWRPKRTIKAGETLQPQWLQPPLLVKRGQTVRAQSNQDGVHLKVETTAENDGKLGDRVKVRSPFGNGLLAAVVVAEGMVRILPGGAVK